MRYILTALLFCVTIFDYAQVADNFSDGDFISNPTWIGEDLNFEIDGNSRLHLNAPAVTDTMYLVTSNMLMSDAEWCFLIQLDFNPSSANLARVYLTSDQSDLTQSLSGYFVQIGGTNDEVSLYEQTGTVVTKIIDGTNDLVDSNPVLVRVKVSRTSSGVWTLHADNTGNSNYVNQGSVTDSTHNSTSYFGVFCKYTSTRSDKFYFDDFKIDHVTSVDTIPPKVTNLEVVSSQVLKLGFSEDVDDLTAQTITNYIASNGLGSPVIAEIQPSNNQVIELTFDAGFQDGVDHTLLIQNVEDDSGNVMLDSTIFFTYHQPFLGNYKGVLITELMVDPSPVVGLPEVEYIELYNNSSQIVSLENWTLSDGSTTTTLVNQTIFPQTYLLCYDPQFGANFEVSNTLETNIPSLNNPADNIILKDDNGAVIDSVSYKVGWYGDNQKSEGGWSLELKDLANPCHDATNWTASENILGGTPGVKNSVQSSMPHTNVPKVIDVFVKNDSLIHFVFDKSILGGIVDIVPALNSSFIIVNSNEVIVTLTSIASDKIYELTVSSFQDCWGNSMDNFTYQFAIPKAAIPGDIAINEVLFNPTSDGADYIELVNISENVLDLNELQIANIDDGALNNLKLLSNKQALWFPGDYLVLTEDSMAIIQTFPLYKTGHFLEIDLPSYNNDSGTVVILNEEIKLIDKFSYLESFHFQLINDLNGKALERRSFQQPTQSEDNWHTASQNSGWGTPGYLNSQTGSSGFGSGVQLVRAIFSPNNDGYQDLLEITYQFDHPDHVMDIVIYNANGEPIKELKDNYYPGKKGSIIWDGLTDEGTKANIGTYLIGVTVFDLDGNLKRYKLVGVLATKL